MKELIRLLAAKVGHLPNLTTAAKNTIVDSINELVAVKALKNGLLTEDFNVKNLNIAGQIVSPIYDNTTSLAIDWNKGNSQKVTINASNNNGNFTFTNDVAGAYYTLILDVTIANATLGWPTIIWPADVAYIKNNFYLGKFVVNLYKISNTEIIGNIGGPFI